jgi:hypothetical protein
MARLSFEQRQPVKDTDGPISFQTDALDVFDFFLISPVSRYANLDAAHRNGVIATTAVILLCREQEPWASPWSLSGLKAHS